MPFYVGLDCAKRTTKICVVDPAGTIVKEVTVPTEPREIVAALRGEGRRYRRVGLEAWSMTPWIYAGLVKAGLPAICIETRHASGILKASRRNKTDKNDARGIAEMMRVGIYRAVHIKSPDGQRLRALLTTRKFLRIKITDTENAIRAALLARGIKPPAGRGSTFETRMQLAMERDPSAAEIAAPLLAARRAMVEEADRLEATLLAFANGDPICRRLMTAPGVGPLCALLYRVAIDEPTRFTRSRNVAPHLGLTSLTLQTGETLFQGRITCFGDAAARSALYMAGFVQFRASSRSSWLKEWGKKIAARRGSRKAIVAVARKLAVILHKMWMTETDFCWAAPP
jgi:transposase